MVFATEDKVFIKNLYMIIGYGLRRLMTELSGKVQKKVWIGQAYYEAAYFLRRRSASASIAVVYRGLRISLINEGAKTANHAIGLKPTCW